LAQRLLLFRVVDEHGDRAVYRSSPPRVTFQPVIGAVPVAAPRWRRLRPKGLTAGPGSQQTAGSLWVNSKGMASDKGREGRGACSSADLSALVTAVWSPSSLVIGIRLLWLPRGESRSESWPGSTCVERRPRGPSEKKLLMLPYCFPGSPPPWPGLASSVRVGRALGRCAQRRIPEAVGPGRRPF
jgi:hypothetical protein